MDFKPSIEHLHRSLGELEDAARKLPNQNAADLIKSARGRIAQFMEHPDLDAVGEQLKADLHEGQEKMPFDPDAKPPAT